MGRALHQAGRSQHAQGAHVDAGRPQQGLAERLVEPDWLGAEVEPGVVEKHAAHERVPVGVKARRGQAQQHVAREGTFAGRIEALDGTMRGRRSGLHEARA